MEKIYLIIVVFNCNLINKRNAHNLTPILNMVHSIKKEPHKKGYDQGREEDML